MSGIAKVFIVLALLFSFAALISPGSETAWTSLSNTITTGPNLPQSGNQVVGYVVPREPTADGNSDTGHYAVGCLTDSDCIDTQDTSSYLRIWSNGSSRLFFRWNWTVNLSATYSLTTATLDFTIICRTISDTTGPFVFRITFNGNMNAPEGQSYCPRDSFATVNLRHDGDNWLNYTANNTFDGSIIEGSVFTLNNATIDLAFVSMTVTIPEAQVVCVGDWFASTGCAINKFVSDANRFFQTAWAYISFAGSVLSAFASGIWASFAWWLAVPGAPTIVQGIIAAGVIGLLALVVIWFLGIIRGTGSGTQ